MKCHICGSEVNDGFAFCTECGAKLIKDNPQPAVSANQQINNNMVQPAVNPQPNQMNQPIYGGQPNQVNQPMYNGQPNQMNQPMYNGQPNQMNQPMYNGQLNHIGQKTAVKPLTGKQKKIIAGCGIGAVFLIVFFTLILPILTRSKLKGAYKGLDSDCVIVFDGDSYIVYEDDDYDRIYDAGSFTVKGSAVTMESISGKTINGTFSKKNNNLKLNSYDSRYKSLNKSKKIGFDIDDDYLDELKEDIEKACKKIVKDEDIYNQARYNYYYFTNDDLDKEERREGFEDELAKELGYDVKEDLKTLMELKFIKIEISFDSDCKPSVNVYSSGYYSY